MTLAELKENDCFTVVRVSAEGPVGKRLAEMGFTSGAHGRVVRTALFGDPIQIHILHYDVSLRKNEAAKIDVDVLPQCGRHRKRRRGKI